MALALPADRFHPKLATDGICLLCEGFMKDSMAHLWPAHLMRGLKRISRVLMNIVGCTMYRALMFFLYLQAKWETWEWRRKGQDCWGPAYIDME